MPGTKPRVTDQQLIDVLKAKGPFLTAIANAVGMNYQAVFARFSRSKKLKDAMALERERMLDIAESHVRIMVAKGDPKMVRYVLDRLGKDRGYTTRAEVVDMSASKHDTFTPDLSGMSRDELKKYMEGLAHAATAIADLQD